MPKPSAKFLICFLVLMAGFLGFGTGTAQAQIIVAPPREKFFVRIAGRVLNADNGRAIPYATVYNRTSKKGVATDTSGFFTIVLSSDDTLQVSHVGYRTLFYQKPPGRNGNYYEDLLLHEQVQELKEVIIYRKKAPLRTIAINPEYGQRDRFGIYLFGAGKPRTHQRASIGSPVTALYESFSKREKDLRKLDQLKADKELRDLAAIRYNEYYVESLTGLHGQDLAAFMGYCPLQPNFVITATDYELAVAVLNCYRRFMNDL